MAPGRAFLRRLIDLTRGIRLPQHRVRITNGARADMQAWSIYLSDFNGTVMFLDSEWRDNWDFQFFTDAAASIGFGIYFANKWAQGRWPDAILLRAYSIAFLELFPIVVGLQMWGALLANSRVVFWSDNQKVVHVVNTQTSKYTDIMKLVRRLVIICLKFNIRFKRGMFPAHVMRLLTPSLVFRWTGFVAWLRTPNHAVAPSRTVFGRACARTEASAGSITGSQHSQHICKGVECFSAFSASVFL